VKKLKVLDLFSGIGGFSLGLERTGGFETVAFCEIEKFPQKVLRKHWPEVPIFEDVRKLDATGLGRIDCVVGGFPCQPWSLAGERKGTEDDRDLWPEMLRVITNAAPEWVIGENVRGFVNEPMGLERSISDLEDAEYKVQAFIVPACAVDAPHRRERVWIVANARHGSRRESEAIKEGTKQPRERPAHTDQASRSGKQPSAVAHAAQFYGRDENYRENNKNRRVQREFGGSGGADNVADANSAQQQRRGVSIGIQKEHSNADSGSNGSRWKPPCFWLPEPRVDRVAHGVPNRSHRLKGLGNAVVPQIPEMIGRAILESYES